MTHKHFIFGLAFLASTSLIFALTSGSTHTSLTDVWSSITGQGSGMTDTVIFELRLPRAASAFVAGGLLALAGALMQVLLRNPLADPYILGISGGASTGALCAITIGLTGIWFHVSTLLGAVISMLLVFSLAHGRGSWTPSKLLLTGVVVAAGWGAIISFVLAISEDTSLRGMLFWLMGDLSYAATPIGGLAVLITGILYSFILSRNLNVMIYGDLKARSLGVSTHALRLQIYVIASILTASAVTIAGNIGFVGLIVPHLVRLMIGNDHRVLLPASVLLGGSLVVTADTVSRILLAPQQIPVGVIMTLIGVPLFLYLLNRS
ncbi:MAG: FecCD family ABC transporter permease [Gammaproteobacteria bacterium]